MVTHTNDFRNDLDSRPFDSEHLGEFLQIDRGCLTNAVHRITEPRHAQVAQLLVEEGLAELSRKKRNILNNGLAHTP